MVELEQQLERTGILEDTNMNNTIQQQANLIPTLVKYGVDLNEIFDFLDEVREHGHTNMFAAPMILVDEFDIPKRLSREIVEAWMNDDRH